MNPADEDFSLKSIFGELAKLRAEVASLRAEVRGLADKALTTPRSSNTKQVTPAEVNLPVVNPPSPPLPPSPAFKPIRGISAEGRAVFDYWCEKMGKDSRTQFDSKRRRVVENQLSAGRSVADLCRAIDGCRRDPFSMGDNDRGVPFNDLSLICRDAAHVEKFMAMAEIAKPRITETTQQRADREAKERANAAAERQKAATRMLLDRQQAQDGRTDPNSAREKLAELMNGIAKAT